MQQENIPVKLAAHGIGFRDKFGYALGDMGNVLTFGLVGAFLQMFYSDVLHISLAKITVLMLVARIWDAVNDPIWGAFVDSRRPGKYGKFRPWLVWVSIPLAIGAVLMFTRIPGLGENQYLIFAYVTYIFYGMMYTGINIPYGSLASVITDDEGERADLSMFRSIGAGLGGLPAQILLPLFVYSTAVGTGAKYLDGNKLFWGVALLAGCSVIVYYFSFKMTRERVPSPAQPPKMHLFRSVKTLLRNRPFVVVCLASMLLIAATMYIQTVYNYLFKDYFQQPKLYSLVTICTYAPMVLLLPVLGKMVRKWGKKEICAAGVLLSGIANLVLCLLHTQSPYVFLVFSFLSGLGVTFITMEIWALITDVVDYQEYLTHEREEGTGYAFVSFARKLGHTMAGSGASWLLGVIGYDVNKTTGLLQSPEVLDKMYVIATVIPAVAFLLMFVLLAFLYPLGKRRLRELHEQLTQRRAQEQAEEA